MTYLKFLAGAFGLGAVFLAVLALGLKRTDKRQLHDTGESHHGS